jgi:hypothetical protein
MYTPANTIEDYFTVYSVQQQLKSLKLRSELLGLDQGENVLLLNSASRMGNKIIMLELDTGKIEILDRSE